MTVGIRSSTAGWITRTRVGAFAVTACLLAGPAHAVTYVVTNTNDAGAGSLRQAILDANSSGATSPRIEFAIAGPGPHTIAPATNLPALTATGLVVDGYTQPGASANTLATGLDATLQVVLDGQDAHTYGLMLTGTGISVRGLVVHRFLLAGIRLLSCESCVVEGNFVGTDASGSMARPNGTGILLTGQGLDPNLASRQNRIGGLTTAARNLVSGNTGDGIVFFEISEQNAIEGNYVGTDRTGLEALPNGVGVAIRNNQGVFHPAMAERVGPGNVIAGNTRDGFVATSGWGITVRQNYVGVGADGLTPLGNGHDGIAIGDPSTLSFNHDIVDNVIAHNGRRGVRDTDIAPYGYGSRLTRNAIFGNAGLGIDLAGDGVTTDGDPLVVESAPSISSVLTVGGLTTVVGVLQSTPSRAFRIEVFANAACDPSGYGEGQTFVGDVEVNTDSAGSASFVAQVVLPSGQSAVTATATSMPPGGLGMTSEFSPCVGAGTTPPAISGQIVDPNGSGLAHVHVGLGGPHSATTLTDEDGRYRFEGLVRGLTYVVTPSRPGFTFDPAERQFPNLQGDQVGDATRFVAATGVYTRYFAEGATGPFFDTAFALLNPTDTAAHVTFEALTADGATVTRVLDMLPRSRATFEADTLSALASAEFSTVVTADVPIIADRTMRWGNDGYGSHAERSLAAPALTWYLAEGATIAGFNLFYLLQNPAAQPAEVRITYLLPAPQVPLQRTYTIAARSRFNVWVNHEHPVLAAAEVSAVVEVTNGVPIVVERAMYRDAAGQTYGAGHASAGITAPATTWFLAEGNTGTYFDLFVQIANPTATDALVTATYLLPTGATLTKDYAVPAHSRFNIWVDQEELPVGSGQYPLADTAVSTTVASTNGVPLIVERSMWWPGSADTWVEGHNSPGSPTSGTTWALADGEVGAAADIETYILIANTSASAGPVQVTLYFDDGTTTTRTFDLTPTSRFNIAVAAAFPEAAGRRFGTVIESLGDNPVQIVVERAMYRNADGVVWAAGSDALATRLR
jgi:hypothetical protein